LSPRVRHYGLPHRDLRSFPTRRSSDLSAVAIVSFSARVDFAHAASWNGIEPLKSRREDVLKILGKPSTENASGGLEFSVAGGTALIVFVDQKFVSNKKLHADLVGTVLEIVLQHDHSTDT